MILPFDILSKENDTATIRRMLWLMANGLTNRERIKNPLALDPIEYHIDVVTEYVADKSGHYYQVTVYLHRQTREWYYEQQIQNQTRVYRDAEYSEKSRSFITKDERYPIIGQTILRMSHRVSNFYSQAMIHVQLERQVEIFMNELLINGAQAIKADPGLIEETII